MSTNTRPTTDSTTTAPPRRATDQRRDHPDTTESWTARCQRQFDTRHTGRLPNCTDETNRAMPDGI